jgi:hypothetical protein
MRYRLVGILIAVCIAAVAVGCGAGGEPWEELDRPPGGGGRLIAATSAGAVYAVAAGGLYVSTDAGRHWEDTLVPATAMRQVAVTDTHVFVAVDSRVRDASPRVLVSEDGGPWRDCTRGLQFHQFISIAALDGDVYLAGVVEAPAVWRLRDGEPSWTRLDGGLRGAEPREVEAVAGHVILLTRGRGRRGPLVFRLDPVTDAWTPASDGIGEQDITGGWTDWYLTVSGGEMYYSSHRGVGYRLLPDGTGWAVIQSTTHGRSAANRRHVPTFNTAPFVEYRGVAYTTEGRHGPDTDIGSIVGVYRSGSAAPAWTRSKGWRDDIWASSLMVTGEALLAGGAHGVHRTTDGRVWEAASDGLGRLETTHVEVRGDHVYAGSNTRYATSTDDGESWSVAKRPDAPLRHGKGAEPMHVSAWRTKTEPGTYYRVDWRGVWRTTDNVGSWEPAGLQEFETTWIALEGGRLFALTADNGLFASNDQGRHWRRRPPLPGGQRITSAAVSNAYVFAVAVDQRLYRAPR